MEPFAYGLRDHVIFAKPFSIDRSQMVEIDTPEYWQDDLDEKKVSVLPLVNDTKRSYPDGWCSYTYTHGTPELEVFCGGVNSKTPKAGAVWRQGNLLHFGFEQAPSELNENGQRLLLNSIAYISKFTEDRPITNTPSPFAPARKRYVRRSSIEKAIAKGESGFPRLENYTTPATFALLESMTQPERVAWYKDNGGFLHGDEKGKIQVDVQASELGISPANFSFFDKAFLSLEGKSGDASAARELLARYAPSGLGREGNTNDWLKWLRENKQYLFFSDTGGYRWYVDPLAKSRKVPTSKLRGIQRATLKLETNSK